MQGEEATGNNFETLVLVVGNCVNEDAGLGKYWCTDGLKDVSTPIFVAVIDHRSSNLFQFLDARVRIPQDDFVGLAKTQV